MTILTVIARNTLALLTGLLMVGSVTAHTDLTASIPVADTVVASPTSITLEFNAEVKLARVDLVSDDETTINLPLDRNAPAAKHTVITLDEPLAPGDYTVKWRAIADDGHIMTGEFGFTVRSA